MSIIKVETDIEDYTITNISDDYISVELRVYIMFKVELIIDDEDYMYKDDDTKEWIFPRTTPILVNEKRYIDVDLIFDIEPDCKTVHEPEIESINKGRNLKIGLS